MWSTKIRNIWDALYPVALYVVVSDCVYMLLTLAIGENTISPMALQILTALLSSCLLYTSDAADDMQCVDLGGRRIIKKNFFKQKTAYEISECLVGSEMCIRDRYLKKPQSPEKTPQRKFSERQKNA